MIVERTGWQRWLSLLLGLTLCLVLIPGSAGMDPTQSPDDVTASPEQAAVPTPSATPFVPLGADELEAASAILIDGLSGEVLFEKDADSRQYPASITKIMTAILAIESGDLQRVVTVGNEVNQLESGSTHIGLKVGEEMSLENLLYGLMMNSGNDAANAIAVNVGGTMEGFATLMNQKAQELGMTESHFVTPSGLHDDEHYVSARDMATLTMYALKNETFAKIVGTRQYTIPATNKEKDRPMVNSNRLISQDTGEQYRYEFAVGVKTGYTSKAQNTYVGAARKDGMLLISVVLKDSQTGKWLDCIKMFNHGYANYITLNLMAELASEPVNVQLANAALDDPQGGMLMFTAEADAAASIVPYKTVKVQDMAQTLENIRRARLVTDQPIDQLSAPIEEGTLIGFRYELDGETILTGKLRASRTVAEKREAVSDPDDQGRTFVLPQPNGGAPDMLIVLLYVIGGAALLILLIIVIRAIILSRSHHRRRRYRPSRRGRRRGLF